MQTGTNMVDPQFRIVNWKVLFTITATVDNKTDALLRGWGTVYLGETTKGIWF